MRVLSDKLFLFIGFLMGTLYVIAGSGGGPPAPNPAGKSNGAMDGLPPSPPGTPIDENLIILLIIALLFGIYVIYKDRLKTKSPI
jgi:ABC-type antimicrobial peptide transport system permease subunit